LRAMVATVQNRRATGAAERVQRVRESGSHHDPLRGSEK
jgi:hypothetical protein